jgi:hypothetical protein
MRPCFTAILIGAVLALLGVGCGKSESNGSSGSSGSSNSNSSGSPKTSEQFVAQLCAEFTDCCKAAGRPSDGAQCRVFFGAFASASNYDEVAAGPCLDEVRAAGDQKCKSSSMNTPSCSKVFAGGGTKQPGEACQDSSECAPAASGSVDCVSDAAGDATVQQCQLRLPGKAGSSPCVGTVDGNITFSSGNGDGIALMGYLCDVADGLTCDDQTNACEAIGATGQPCTNGLRQCVSSAYCSFDDFICKDRVALGSACESDDACQVGTYCEAGGDTCAAQSAPGLACATNAECLSDNCTNQTCGPSDDLGLALLCGT